MNIVGTHNPVEDIHPHQESQNTVVYTEVDSRGWMFRGAHKREISCDEEYHGRIYKRAAVIWWLFTKQGIGVCTVLGSKDRVMMKTFRSPFNYNFRVLSYPFSPSGHVGLS